MATQEVKSLYDAIAIGFSVDCAVSQMERYKRELDDGSEEARQALEVLLTKKAEKLKKDMERYHREVEEAFWRKMDEILPRKSG